jgi:hypothetical protein
VRAFATVRAMTRVCPACGSPAKDQRFCGECGLNLGAEPRIPTREEWEARQQPGEAPHQPAHRGRAQQSQISTQDIMRWFRGLSARARAAIGLAIVAVIAGLVVAVVASGDPSGEELQRTADNVARYEMRGAGIGGEPERCVRYGDVNGRAKFICDEGSEAFNIVVEIEKSTGDVVSQGFVQCGQEEDGC